MGWYFGNATRAELIRELTSERMKGTRCLAHTAVGNVLWTVWEIQTGQRFIGCDLMMRSGGDWGHKPMDEAMGPGYYSCPLRYLEMVPEVASPEWREQVRAYHAERSARRELLSTIAPGQVLYLKQASIPFVTVSSTRPLRGVFAGALYCVAERFVDPDQSPRPVGGMQALAPATNTPTLER